MQDVIELKGSEWIILYYSKVGRLRKPQGYKMKPGIFKINKFALDLHHVVKFGHAVHSLHRKPHLIATTCVQNNPNPKHEKFRLRDHSICNTYLERCAHNFAYTARPRPHSVCVRV